jgi:hypothetical protein
LDRAFLPVLGDRDVGRLSRGGRGVTAVAARAGEVVATEPRVRVFDAAMATVDAALGRGKRSLDALRRGQVRGFRAVHGDARRAVGNVAAEAVFTGNANPRGLDEPAGALHLANAERTVEVIAIRALRRCAEAALGPTLNFGQSGDAVLPQLRRHHVALQLLTQRLWTNRSVWFDADLNIVLQLLLEAVRTAYGRWRDLLADLTPVSADSKLCPYSTFEVPAATSDQAPSHGERDHQGAEPCSPSSLFVFRHFFRPLA